MMSRKKKQVAQVIEFPQDRVIRVLDPKTLKPRKEAIVKKPKKQTVRNFLDEIYQDDDLTHRTKKKYTEGIFIALSPDTSEFKAYHSDGITNSYAVWALELMKHMTIEGAFE